MKKLEDDNFKEDVPEFLYVIMDIIYLLIVVIVIVIGILEFEANVESRYAGLKSPVITEEMKKEITE